MKAKKAVLASILPVVLLALGEEVSASSGNPVAHLAWKPGRESLEYRSCGAADACWAAQVKDRRTDKRIATLRCDGEKLFSRVGNYSEKIAAEDCHEFENENKFRMIPAALRALLHR